MPSEVPFRISLLTILVFTMVVGVYHRWQAAKSGDRISRKAEGLLLAEEKVRPTPQLAEFIKAYNLAAYRPADDERAARRDPTDGR